MSFFKNFYINRVSKISDVNQHLFYTVDNVLIVNLDKLWNADGYFWGTNSLIYLIHKNGIGKKILFLSQDGSDLIMSNISQIIEKVIEGLDLDFSTCGVVCRDPLMLTNVEVIHVDAVTHWAQAIQPYLDDYPLPVGPFDKKFAVWYKRPTYARTEIAMHLYENYRVDSIISYISNEFKSIGFHGELQGYVPEMADWGLKNLPILYDNTKLYTENHLYDIFSPQRKPYDKYFIDIISETNTINPVVTEKTVRCLYSGKPFLIMGGVNQLEKLKSLGFKTFSLWFDESYDTEKNVYLRLKKILKEIDKIANLSYHDIHQIYNEMTPILLHNKKQCQNFANCWRNFGFG